MIYLSQRESLKPIYFSGNTLFNFYGVSSKGSKLLDGDKSSWEENDDREPFMLVQLRNSTSISQLSVHLELG